MGKQQDAVNELNESVITAYARDGFTREDGTVDHKILVESIREIVTDHVVSAKNRRNEIAITLGDLVSQVFPNLPADNASWEAKDDPDLAEKVYKRISGRVWSMVGPRGVVQKSLPNGYVVCRTKVGTNQVKATYVTEDPACISTDLIGPEIQKADRSYNRAATVAVIAAQRVPSSGRRFARDVEASLKALQVGINAKLQLAIEMIADSNKRDDDNGSGSDHVSED
jgi:hypothetical protein